MPTKKRRIGFIPRSEVLNLINKLSLETNLSNSKIISVRWENFKHKKKNFVAKINVIIKNKIGSLGSLSSIIGRSMSNIRNLKITDRNKDFFKIDVEIDVIDLDHFNKVLVSLRTSEFVETVSRL